MPPDPAMVRSWRPPPRSNGWPGRTITGLIRSSVCNASNSHGTSSSLSSSGGIDTPPGITALARRPFHTPPHTSSMIWRNVMPIGSSNTPGLLTWPDTHTMRVPPERPMPSALNHAPPLSMIAGTFISVSTLFTIVGLPNRPFTAGNGGLSRG